TSAWQGVDWPVRRRDQHPRLPGFARLEDDRARQLGRRLAQRRGPRVVHLVLVVDVAESPGVAVPRHDDRRVVLASISQLGHAARLYEAQLPRERRERLVGRVEWGHGDAAQLARVAREA